MHFRFSTCYIENVCTFGVFKIFSNYRQSCILNIADRRVKRTKSSAYGIEDKYLVYTGYDFFLRSFSADHSVYFRFSKTLYLEIACRKAKLLAFGVHVTF